MLPAHSGSVSRSPPGTQWALVPRQPLLSPLLAPVQWETMAYEEADCLGSHTMSHPRSLRSRPKRIQSKRVVMGKREASGLCVLLLDLSGVFFLNVVDQRLIRDYDLCVDIVLL